MIGRIPLDLTIYHGWKIFTHVGEVQPEKISNVKHKIQTWFDNEDWSFEVNDRIIITNENVDAMRALACLEIIVK